MEDRVRIDRQVGDDLLHRRQLIARPQDPQPNRVPDLLHELQVRRHP
jgi:hypothetical protein